MLRGIKASLLLASVAVVGLALWAGAQVEPTGSRMAVTADRFVESLTQSQVAKATYPVRFARAAQLALHSARPQGAADQGAEPGTAGAGVCPDPVGPERVGLLEGHDDHEPRADSPRARERVGPGARSRALLPDDFRQARRSREVGLADRGASPVAQLHTGRRQDHRGHAGFLRFQSGRGAPGTAPGPAYARGSRRASLASGPSPR